MRVQFDASKDTEVLRKHGVSLAEAREIFDQTYIVDAKNDDPEQFRAIGWSRGRICSVIFEVRRDTVGEYYHLVTAWKATNRKAKPMPNKFKPKIAAEEIADRASRGEDVSMFFTGKFTVIKPVRRVNVDLTQGMLTELDAQAARLNVSRQAVIKTLLRHALDQNNLPHPTGKRKAS